jgi:hypothetical protein
MPNDLIRYDLLVQDALKGVVRRVLADAAKEGLGGEHHFYISFRTDFPGVRLSNRLREKYPQEMTIVLQHQFWDLGITEHAFEVGLSFSGVPERLLVPFDALTGFFDPSVQFGLKFELKEDEEKGGDESPAPPAEKAGPKPVELAPKKPVLPVAAKSAAPKIAANPQPQPDKAKADKAQADKAQADKAGKAEKPKPGKAEPSNPPAPGGEVVSLDAFRKKS